MLPARTVGTSLSVLAGVALASYPLLVYATIGRFGPAGIAVVLGLVCVARLVVFHLRGRISVGGYSIALICIGGVLLATVSYWRNSTSAVLFYPVLVNAVLLAVFATSLWRPPTVIERIARIHDAGMHARRSATQGAVADAGMDARGRATQGAVAEPALPPAAVVYTRRVTIVWSVFFALNGAAALYTAVAAPLETWTLYNGLIAYLLIGALFVSELAVRSVWRARLKL